MPTVGIPPFFRTREQRMQKVMNDERTRGVHRSWEVNGTKLKNYALPPGKWWFFRKKAVRERLDAEALLVQEIEKSSAKGERLGILDIGIGTGRGWRKPLQEYGEKFGLCATTLCDCPGIWEGIRPMLKFTNAANVHLHYPKESFDIIFSHYGLHMELGASLEGIISLLKKGGQAMLSGYGDVCLPSHEVNDYHAYRGITRGELGSDFKVVKAHTARGGHGSRIEWFLQLQKTGAPQDL